MRLATAVLAGCLIGILLSLSFTAHSGGTESRNLAIIIFRHEKLNLTMQRTLFKMNESQMQAFKILAQVIWGNQLETEAVFSKLKIQFTLMNRLLDQLDEMIQQEMKTFHLTDADLPFEPDAGR